MAFLKPINSKRSGKKWLQFFIVAIVVVGGLTVAYKYLPTPSSQKQRADKTKDENLPKIIEEDKPTEGLPPQGGIQETQNPSSQESQEKPKETSQTVQTKGFGIKVPSDWKIKEKDAPAAAGQAYTTLESADFTQTVDQSSEIPINSVKGGSSLSISRQELGEKNFIKDFDSLKEFWKLGRGGHIVKSEKETTVAGQRALLHILGDLNEGSLVDVHFLTADNKTTYDIALSYNNKDYSGDYGKDFSQILSSLTLK